jgi:hypothetical protein
VEGDKTVALAVAMLEFRRARMEMLPSELFGEPAWDLLLELFVADAKGIRLTAKEVSPRAGVSLNVMSRWLLHLSKIGFVVGDGNGDVDDFLTLSGEGMDKIERLLSLATDLRHDIG